MSGTSRLPFNTPSSLVAGLELSGPEKPASACNRTRIRGTHAQRHPSVQLRMCELHTCPFGVVSFAIHLS